MESNLVDIAFDLDFSNEYNSSKGDTEDGATGSLEIPATIKSQYVEAFNTFSSQRNAAS